MLNILLKLSDLRSDFTLTLGYLNLALNNLALKIKSSRNFPIADTVVFLMLHFYYNLSWIFFSVQTFHLLYFAFLHTDSLKFCELILKIQLNKTMDSSFGFRHYNLIINSFSIIWLTHFLAKVTNGKKNLG